MTGSKGVLKESGQKAGRMPRRDKSKEVKIGITESKSGNFSEWYTQVVLKAELADYIPVKGMIAVRPDGYAVWELIQRAFDDAFKRAGVRNAFLPTLIPESLLNREKSHFEGFNPEVYWVTHSGDSEIGDRLALRPTSETLAYSMYAKWIKSWRDLPLKLNFWNTALRAEIKSTKPFLRTSEFLWQEGHTAHTTRQEAARQVETMLEIYRNVVETYLAVPVESGRKSRREQFVGAEYTLTIESIMPDGRALQMGTSHLLGQNFSVPFGVKFADKDNVERHVWQTSWGVSWRLLGALIMVHGDDKGLILPPQVAPLQVVIVPILGRQNKDERVQRAADAIRDTIQGVGIRVSVDDRVGLQPGFKFNDWEMRGIPLRLEIGPRDVKRQEVVLVRRDTGIKQTVPDDDIGKIVSEMLDVIQSDMLDAARRKAANLTGVVSDYDSLISGSEKGGFLKASWCGDVDCEESIREKTGAEIRLIFSDRQDDVCVRCGRQSNHQVLFARGY